MALIVVKNVMILICVVTEAIKLSSDQLHSDELVFILWIRDALVELTALERQALLVPIFLLIDQLVNEYFAVDVMSRQKVGLFSSHRLLALDREK